ncbi:MAG: hypothetical protein AB7H96_03645 [Vicinamibacterales bacterium]
MFRVRHALLSLMSLATMMAPATVAADDTPRDVNCSVWVEYRLNTNTPQQYNTSFALPAGTTFHDDFGTAVRFKEFNASSRLDGDGNTVVDFDYYNEVNAFDAVDFSSSLTLWAEKGTQVDGRQSFYSSRAGGTHRTNWVVFCVRDGK